MSWDDIIKDVAEKKAQKKPYSFSSADLSDYSYKNPEKQVKRKPLKVYSLGKRYGSVYFTQREAECMVLLLRGKTINKVAEKLGLSPRTVEFYLKNMKIKLGCRTKFELIDLIYESDFMSGVDF